MNYKTLLKLDLDYGYTENQLFAIIENTNGYSN